MSAGSERTFASDIYAFGSLCIRVSGVLSHCADTHISSLVQLYEITQVPRNDDNPRIRRIEPWLQGRYENAPPPLLEGEQRNWSGLHLTARIMPRPLWNIVQACWAREPADRPIADVLVEMIDSVVGTNGANLLHRHLLLGVTGNHDITGKLLHEMERHENQGFCNLINEVDTTSSIKLTAILNLNILDYCSAFKLALIHTCRGRILTVSSSALRRRLYPLSRFTTIPHLLPPEEFSTQRLEHICGILYRLQVRLAIERRIIPDRIRLNNVERISDDRDRWGGFADIYMGRLPSGQVVALKRLRLGQQTPYADVYRLEKVDITQPSVLHCQSLTFE